MLLHQKGYCKQLYFEHRRTSLIKCFAASSSDRRDQFARSAKSAGKEASRRLKEAYVVVEDNVKRTASQVNAKFDVTGKAQYAAEQVSEQAKAVDSNLGLMRRIRNLADDVQRKAPLWRKKYAEFSGTKLGQATFLLGIFLLFYTGIAFKLLNALFILWWLAPFLLLLSSKLNPQANERARRQAAQREAQARQSEFLRNAFFGRQQRPQQGPNFQRRKYDDMDSGPVIDVEYTTLDE